MHFHPCNNSFRCNREKHVVTNKYHRLVRIQQLGAYIKIAVFYPKLLQKGIRTPTYEIFINTEGKEYITRELDKKGNETRWLTAMAVNLGEDFSDYTRRQRIYINPDGKRTLQNLLVLKPDAGQKGWERLIVWQRRIKEEQIKRREEREVRPWDEDMKLVPNLPKSFPKWMQRHAADKVYIIYDYGSKEGWCTKCQRMVPVKLPRHNAEAICPHCKAKAVYKASGKCKTLAAGPYYAEIIQKIPGGIVVRSLYQTQNFRGIHDIVENGLTWENATILLMGVLETFGGFLLLFGSKYIIPFGKSLLVGIGGAFSGVPLLMQTSLTDIIAGVKMGEIGAASLGATIGTTIVAAIVAAIVGFKLGEKINEWITGEQIDMSFTEMMGEIKDSVTDGTWKEALALWKEDIDDGLIAINDDYNEWTKGIREKISTAFDETKQDFAQVKAEAKQGLAELKNDIKEELNGGIGHVEGFINKVVSGINSLISLLNAIKVDIPDNVPIIGGVSWGGLNLAPLNTVKIPRLANGGIATSSTIVNIAEQGKEAVLPLENNTGWMDDLANKLSQKIEVTVVPVPDPSGIFETVRVQAVEYNKSTGDRAFS